MSTQPLKIEVLLFAALGELAGRRRLRVAVAPGATAADVWAALPVDGPAPASLRYAVNTEWVAPDHRLRAGDTVALITAVSGG
jgi:molybdopterin converting factor small subunit